jgi:hypothetical protein
MKFRIGVSAALFVTAVITSVPAVRAQYNASPPWKGAPSQSQANPHPRLAACSFKSLGSTCTFSRNGHTLSGSCQPVGGGQMACIDAIGRPGLTQHPPDEGMSAGDLPNQ